MKHRVASALHDPTIVVRGDVPHEMVSYGRTKLAEIMQSAPVPVLATELRMLRHGDPAAARPYDVEVSIDLDGTPVRAHCRARTMTEALDQTFARVRRRVDAALERPRSLHFRERESDSWHHTSARAFRPDHFDRPVEDRMVVRRKTFALEPESIDDAVLDLEFLDHDFLLFVHEVTGEDALVARSDGGYVVSQATPTPNALAAAVAPVSAAAPPTERTVEEAEALLDATDAPFVFFVDARTGRGNVVYRRYDGHYGVITPT
jgi:hypothetical protein